jgi:translocation protein SEC72
MITSLIGRGDSDLFYYFIHCSLRFLLKTIMSHSHSHGPGEDHSHSHSLPTPGLPTPDPKLQNIIEQDFEQVPLVLSADKNNVHCEKHNLEKCHLCDVDFVQLNRLCNILLQHPTLLCPPPANVITPKITQLVTATKEEGNVCIIFFFGHINTSS